MYPNLEAFHEKIPQLLKTALTAAAALMIIALPGCHKQNPSETAPATPEDHAQSVPEVADEIQAPETTSAQDMQILKEVADNEQASDAVAAVYGPAEALPNAPLQEDTSNLDADKNSNAPNLNADKNSKKVATHKQEQHSSAMDAMLAKGLDMDNLDWSSFDPEREWPMAAYYGPTFNDSRLLKQNNTKDIGANNQAKVTVKLQTPVVTGSLDKRVIRKVVNNHIGELRACYEKELTKTKNLLGKVVFEWIINPDGNVSIVIIQSSSLNNKNMETCLLNSIKFWRFPAPKGGGMAKVEFPISFTCESAEYYRAHPNEKTKPKPDLGSI